MTPLWFIAFRFITFGHADPVREHDTDAAGFHGVRCMFFLELGNILRFGPDETFSFGVDGDTASVETDHLLLPELEMGNFLLLQEYRRGRERERYLTCGLIWFEEDSDEGRRGLLSL